MNWLKHLILQLIFIFFCEVPPTRGGETPILSSNEVYCRLLELHPEYMQELEQKGVKYIRVMPTEDDHTSTLGRGWKSTYLCETKDKAEEGLRKLGSTWEWLENGDLKTISTVLPAIRTDEGKNRSNQKQLFSQIIAAYTGWNDSRNIGKKALILGDNQAINEKFMEDAERIVGEVCVAFPWNAGDIMLCDNRTVMHSRRPFEGPRRILVSLGRDPER